MIKIDADLKTLKAQVDALTPTWRSRAAKRTAEFIKQKEYNEKTSIWGEVKAIFMNLHPNKCVYCERDMAGEEFGSGEYDLEHYRPKGRIEPYPTTVDGVTFSFPTGDSQPKGYYWLAYDLENYAVACITCNRGLKADRFPIAGTRGTALSSVTELNQIELPLLLFPLRDDPEEFITFIGTTPIPKAKQGLKFKRALVTIAFFRLADEKREELYAARVKTICELWTQFEIIQTTQTASKKTAAQKRIDTLCSPKSGHSACAKAFFAMLQNDPERAWRIYEDVVNYEPIQN